LRARESKKASKSKEGGVVCVADLPFLEPEPFDEPPDDEGVFFSLDFAETPETALSLLAFRLMG
jgi:hypothetical protein